MGTCMAPSYANIFMGILETDIIEKFPIKPYLWLRYIDDIFMIWTHGQQKLNEFIEHINSFHPTIKFTANSSVKQVPFLDVLVTMDDGILQTDLYSKPTDTFNYLHWKSCHPYHTKKSIPYSLAFRLVRICSTSDSLTRRLDELRKHLRSRGFPRSQIDAAFQKATSLSRHEAIKRKNKSKKNNDRIPFVLTYNPRLPNFATILHTFFPILQTSDRCKKAIPHVPLVSFRKPPNIRSKLVRARVDSGHSTTKGFDPCRSSRCKTCNHSSTSTNFTSEFNGKRFDILQSISCFSYNLIYLITCLKCKKQYVGQTEQTLRQRMNSHRHTIINNKDTPVARHFNLPGHHINHLHVIGIDAFPTDNRYLRLNKETFWIHTLQTLEPKGINVLEQNSYPISHRLTQ